MKKITFSICLLLSLMMSDSMMAGPRTRQQAQQIAQDKAESLGLKVVTTTSEDNAPYYVFNNVSNKGWTVVSGDDRMPEILAYSDEGTLDMDNLPDPVKDIFASITKYYNNLDVQENTANAAAKAARRVATGTQNLTIGPLLTTTWDQFEPYYRLTPESDGKHCATCCVATAMAQILYYLYYTQAGQSSTTFTNAINNSAHGTISAPRTYEWAKMLPSYKGANYTDEQVNAVATLMRDCGYVLNANYGVSVSTAYSDKIKSAGATYFGLNSSSATYKNYTDIDEFFAAIDAELNTYHPVQVCGANHSYVCDGRDATGQYYHFNFGYSGGGNGFYCSDAYNGYGSAMALSTGLRLANDPTTPKTATDKLKVVYNAAVKTAGLRPVGTIPGMYQQTNYEALKGYLDTAKGVLDLKTSMSDNDIVSLINNIGTAQQKMTSYTTPYPDDWYYINTATLYKGQYFGLKYYKEGSLYYTALYGGYNEVQKFKFVYDEASNGYYISNYGATTYLVSMPGYGKDPKWTTTVADKIPCEVVTTDRIGDSERFMVTIRPMAEGYKDDADRYLAAWTNNTESSWVATASDTPCWVYGGDPYGDYGKWTLTSVTKKTTPTVSFAESNLSMNTGEAKTQTVTTNSDGTITYSSNDITVATVDPSTGAVTGVSEGTATITAAIGASKTYAATIATYTVTVTTDPAGIRVANVDNNENADAPVFNLAGQRVNANTKGVIIRNGKKMINK